LKRHLVRYALGLSLLLLLLGHAARRVDLEFVDRLDAILYDTRLRLAMPGGIDDRVVIVDIDEKSLAEVGRWPWGRDRLAQLVDKLFDRHGTALVAFDVVFAEPDSSSGLPALESLAQKELRDVAAFQTALRDLRPRLDHDARFARSLAGRPVVLGYYLSSRGAGASTGSLPPPTLPVGSFQGRPIAFTAWDTFGANLPLLQANAAGGGHFNPITDLDGTVRRVPMLVDLGGQYYESLSLAVIRTLLGAPPVKPGYGDEGMFASRRYSGLEWLELPTDQGSVRIPVDENVAALVPYRGPQGSFPYLSAADVLADRVAPERLKDRIVLVGTTAPGLMDLRATPVAQVYPGVEIHANLVAGLLGATLMQQPAYTVGVNVVLMTLAGAVMVFLLPLLPPLRAAAVGLAVLLVLVGVNLAFWHAGQTVVPLAGSLLLVLALFAFNMSWGYFVESHSKRRMTRRFGQYVPPELVDEMARDPETYSMEGRRAELTVLFSDIRGFTSLSEGLPPDRLAALINEYLGTMTGIVRQRRGTLDKYIGDAIMAFWGAPLADPDHARNAVLCALDMQAALPDLNRRLAAKGWPPLQIGIGINTGPMTVGDMGSSVRKAYTVLGDAVNLGSRLEGLTKHYGVGIIVGEETRELAKLGLVFRELDRVRVRGKEAPVAIYEPLGEEGGLPAERLEELRLWNQMLRLYRAQDWDQAELALLNLSRQAPRSLYDLYSARIAYCRAQPPGPSWDGVWTFESK
jgi:adenylate cyclase